MATTAHTPLRHHLKPDDAAEIAALHRRVYGSELGFGSGFGRQVEADVRASIARGWPEAGGVWIVEGEAQLRGSLALTFEGQAEDGVYLGRVRWFVLEPALRGTGLARHMFEDLLDTAEDQGMDRLELFTCADLRAAGHLYRSYGFTLRAEFERDDWRRDRTPVLVQQYVLTRSGA